MVPSPFAGIHPSQHPFLHQNAPVAPSRNDRPETMTSVKSEITEPPLKRLRTETGAIDSIAHSSSIPRAGLPRQPGRAKNSLQDHDFEATSTSVSSSLEPGKSSTPPSTPATSIPTPPTTSNLSDVESKKFDLPKYRPRSSIPSKLTPAVYGQQCVAAAYASRLDPYALHENEQELLQDSLCHMHVTVYLNIRNGILRLWTRNPMVSVSREEALGCAKDYRWMNLAIFAYDWLARHGYINFGCVEIPIPVVPPRRGRRKEGPVILVVGAGVGGLGCARQLEGLFKHYRDSDTEPRVVVIEGRPRIGGRVYSHPLRSLQTDSLPTGLRPKAEMGAQIIIGFDRGNPLDQIIRGQLALHHHFLHDLSTIYDHDGSPVPNNQDEMVNKLYQDISERAFGYRHEKLVRQTAEGDRDMINSGRETTVDDGITVRQWEEARAAGTTDLLVPTKHIRRRRGVGHNTGGQISTSLSERGIESEADDAPAALTAQTAGWRLKSGFVTSDSLELDQVAHASDAQNLGAVMDEGVNQYREMLRLTPKDMRLLNWHFANLEYSFAANPEKLSLTLADQDSGNEFEGLHSMVVGGYNQLPYGLYSVPDKLDVRTNKTVTKISYGTNDQSNRKATVYCADGERFVGDHVVYTGSLGTLQHRSVEFDPPLPEWKQNAVDRLGFGLLNKVVLVFDEPFWDVERDFFGLLRTPENLESMKQEDYANNRGRFYLFWNCIRTTGLPVLVGLMAGDAAYQAEQSTDAEIVTEVTTQLRNVFKHATVPDPLEIVVTRWASDSFTRGSYSFVAAGAHPEDYETMARPVGNLHFAGEATCGTHPATVHGAYLSGLRAAAEVIEATLGPIQIPLPLVPDKPIINGATPPTVGTEPDTSKRSVSATPLSLPKGADKNRLKAYEQAMWTAIYAELGPAPTPPTKSARNPFLLYQKDFWAKCKEQCDDARRVASGNPSAKASRNDVRAALGLMWRNAPQEQRQPYIEQVGANRKANENAFERFKSVAAEWNQRSLEVKAKWCAENPIETWQASSDSAALGQVT
ncbi:Lysine-specific histone demethylase 1 [Penicillium ucsense]|uniref:Lysine-specific histone demethylase 1 n=1 Tax=Penicillium ucsense TaxID=2839758 RepID=A0A8J8W0L6_9EURO|nr:Lysine-specific histone demethylase 1 [Penicillium ucsense]KAF7733248.1 Lysine-specific histone demethylase 1 [Penicillium ucsense]